MSHISRFMSQAPGRCNELIQPYVKGEKRADMKKTIGLFLLALTFIGCNKDKNNEKEPVSCDMEKVKQENASKVTITGGIWGTLALMTGNCMPLIDPANTTCKTCPTRRTLRIYEYTTRQQATQQTPGAYFDSFSTRLLKEFSADDNGFFQTEIVPGRYTIVAVDQGKLYAFGLDGHDGISPLTVTDGKQQTDLAIINAVF